MFEDVEHLKSGMDLQQGRVKHDTPVDRLPDGELSIAPKSVHPLDTPEMQRIQRRLLGYYETELIKQGPNRTLMARDEDYYDNEQIDEKTRQELEERGQTPIVYNVISSTINWVLGSEKRGRSDFKVLPRRKDGSKPAERKSQLLKYLSDVNRTPFSISTAFEDATKAGVGWLEAGVQDEDDGEPVYARHESWRNMLWDSTATEKDLSDGRYIIRTKWVDLDVALAMFPRRAGALNASATDGLRRGTDLIDGDEAMDSLEDELMSTTSLISPLDGQYSRPRVRLIEVWYRTPTKVERLRGGDFSGDRFEKDSPAHQEQLDAGHAVLAEKVMMRVKVAVMTTSHLLFHGDSPYRHNKWPFTPVWGNRRARTGLPYGMIRGMIGLQDDINQRAMKALYILSTNKVVMDEGAVPDLDAFAEEVARPDGILVKKKGHELKIDQDRDLAAPHLEMMSRSISLVQSQSGVTDELMGRTTNARSGVAIEARQSQGSLSTSGLFENLRYAKQVHGEKELSLTEQYFTEEKSFRITNTRGSPDYITVNDGLPENDIVRTKADYIISEDDWRSTVRQAQVEELMELMMKLAPASPQIAMVMLDLIVEGMDVPSRDEIVRRIRQVTGMRDPDAEQPTQEEVAKAQEAAEQAAMQKAMMQAQIAEKQASAQAKAAQAGKVEADAKAVLAGLAGTNVATQVAALQAALAMLTAPGVVPVADGVLHEAGFVSRTEEDAAAQEAQRQALEAAAAEQQAAQAQQPQPQAQPEAPQQPGMM